MRLNLVVLIFLLAGFTKAQSYQEAYLSAKNNFKNNQFSEAVSDFAPLVNGPVFGAYATFYLGLSYAELSNYNQAVDAWRQLLIRYPAFSQTDDVRFWITKTLFDQQAYSKGVIEAQKIQYFKLRKQLYEEYLGSLSFNELRALFDVAPNDHELATLLIRNSTNTDLTSTDQFFLDGMIARLNIRVADLEQFPDIRKESYSIAVMLPFLFDGLDNPDRTMRNSLVMDLYQGMLLAEEMLQEKGLKFTLYPYDTQRDSTHTKALLRNPNIKKVDAIIGPLFPETSKVVREFSNENKINQINPLSSSSAALENNPFAFIMKPDYETMAREAAKFMSETANGRMEAKVYFENKPMERGLAEAYKKYIEEKGFIVSEFSPIDNKSARQVLAQFTEQEEVVLNITPAEYENLKEEGRQIRDREKFDASGNLIKNEDGTSKLEYYELVFTADTDSLDHLFAVTKSNLLANNFVGAVESIADTVRLLGLGEWLDFSMLDYKQLERLGVYLIHPRFKDRTDFFYQEVMKRYQVKYGKSPGDFGLQGFEGIYWLGSMLSEHGKYFQNGFLVDNNFRSVFSGQQFVPGRCDNQIVPIVQFLNQELKLINRVDEDRKE